MRVCISKNYNEKRVFENLTVEINEGEILCVLGVSGSGKTTFLNALAGVIDFDGEITPPVQKAGYIFQEPRLIPTLNMAENLRYVLPKNEKNEKEIDKILKKVELLDRKNDYPSSLSGGEKQRVAIARAFLTSSPLLLLDEPFSSLDIPLKLRLGEVFASLWKEKKHTAVFVTHDIEEAYRLAHRVVVIKDGKIALDIRLDGEIPRKYGDGAEIKEMLLNTLIR